MLEHFKAVKVTDKVYWVGGIDWEIRNFHGYNTSRGTTYNAFLVLADKITLIDTVKSTVRDEFLSRIASIIDPSEIDIIVSNHSEPDHAGLIKEMIDICNPEVVYASTMGAKNLKAHFPDDDLDITVVKDGENFSLGNMEIVAYESRMLHWPDSMVTYLADQKILFSNDIFGMHLATYKRFDDEIDKWLLDHEAQKYFANIIMPFSPFVLKFLDKLEKLNLDIEVVATDHGPIWRTYIKEIIENYEKWAIQEPLERVLIVFDTMWSSTGKMAGAIAEGVQSQGVQARMMPLSVSHRSDVANEVLASGALVLGTPVLNNNIFPTIADTLLYIKGLHPQNLIGSVFGSYGWCKPPIDELKNVFEQEMDIEYVGEIVKANYTPSKQDLKDCFEQGILIANTLKERRNEAVEMSKVRLHS